MELDEAARRLLEATDHRRVVVLPHPDGPSSEEELAGVDLEADVVDRDRAGPELLGDIHEPGRRLRHRAPPRWGSARPSSGQAGRQYTVARASPSRPPWRHGWMDMLAPRRHEGPSEPTLPPLPSGRRRSVRQERDGMSETGMPSRQCPRPAPRRGTPKRSTIVVSLLMATVSIISAVVANRAAYWSATAGDLGGQAIQEVLETQQIEDDLRAMVDADTRLIGRYDAAWKRADQLRTQASDLGAEDPATAAQLDIEAQGEFGVDVALWRFFRAAFPSYDADGELRFDADAALTALRAGDVRLAELARSDARALTNEARERTNALVAVAAVFVASLFALTVAEVGSGRRRRVAIVAGIALAGVATVLAVMADLASGAVVIGTALIAVAVIASVVAGPPLLRRWRAARRPPAETTDEGTTRAADTSGPIGDAGNGPRNEPSGRFAATIGVLLAGATLLGAVVGVFQGRASDAGDVAAGQARDQALEALNEHQASNQWSTSQVEQWTRVLEQRARAVAARQSATYWSAHDDPALAARETAEAEQRGVLAERAAGLTELRADHPDGPEADPDFPLRFFASQGEQTARRVALQDLANEANAYFGSVSAGHVAVLATIAIAAYLLGLSLVLDDRRSQRVFGVVGTGMLLVSGVWAVWNEMGAPQRPDAQRRDAIAGAYARASVAAATARTPAEWKVAEGAYRAASSATPRYRGHGSGWRGPSSCASPPRSGVGFHERQQHRRGAGGRRRARDGAGPGLVRTSDPRATGGFYETSSPSTRPRVTMRTRRSS